MTTNATDIRDAIFTRAQAARTFATARKTDIPTLTGADLPALQVFLLSEDGVPHGDDNVSAPRFMTTATIGISVLRGFDDPAALDGTIDSDVGAILDALLSDPTFTSPPPAGQDGFVFEAVPTFKRRRLFPQQGETYLIELRLELTFTYEMHFSPPTPNALEQVAVSVDALTEIIAP